MASYSMEAGKEVWYRVSENGVATVSLRSTEPMKPRAVYMGTASMQFMWVSTGKSTHWQFMPMLLNPTPAQYTQTTAEAGQSQVTDIEIPRLHPTSGLIKTNLAGEIRAPAIHFDLPYATDIWVFILRSPWSPTKIDAQKSSLAIMQGSTQANLQVSTSNYDEDTLRLDVSVHGEGFKEVSATLKRKVEHASFEETLCTAKGGLASCTWKPYLRNFDVALVTPSSMYSNVFVDFLKYLGAQAQQSMWSNYMQNDFLLCDGAAIEYTLSLKGEKRFRDKEDKTSLALRY